VRSGDYKLTFGTFGDGNFDWWWKPPGETERKGEEQETSLVEKIIDATRGINEKREKLKKNTD